MTDQLVLAPANSWLRRIAGHWVRERSDPCPEGDLEDRG